MDNKLDGWKAIAGHIDKTVKTAQRWERDLGLPVRRVGSGPAGTKHSVFAYTDEINEWLDGAHAPPVADGRFGARLMLGGLVGAALLVAAVAGGYLTGRAGPVKTARVTSDSTTLQALDDNGDVVWSRVFTEPLSSPRHKGQPPWLVVDMDGDGLNEIACLCPLEPQSSSDGRRALGVALFDHDGRELWWYRGGRAITLDERDYADSYVPALVETGGGHGASRYLVVVAYHRPYHPTQVSILDRDGRLIGEYWNAGYVFDVAMADVDQDQVDEIVFAGVNNDLGLRPIAGIIEHDVLGGLSPGPATFPDSLKQGEELAYVVMPLTATSRSLGIGSWAYSVHQIDNAFSFEVHFADPSGLFERVYLLDAELSFMRVTFPQSFKRFLAERQRLGSEVTLAEEVEAAQWLDRYPLSVGTKARARDR